MKLRAINVTLRKDEGDCGGEFGMARILLEKYFFNRNVPIGTGYTRTNMEWKMRKDHSVMENRSEREGSKINPCSITHFPALAALQDQPNVVLSMDVSSKGSRNKILLQLCQATLKKKKKVWKSF